MYTDGWLYHNILYKGLEHLLILYPRGLWNQSLSTTIITRHRTSQELKVIKITHAKSMIVVPYGIMLLKLLRNLLMSFATNVSMLSVSVSSIASQFTTSLTLTFQAANPVYFLKPYSAEELLLLLLLSRFSRVRLCATHRRQPTRRPSP